MYTKDELIQVNNQLLAKDDSDLWPINGKFNATKRAIKRVQKAMRDGLPIEDALEYTMIVENEITNIVNGEV